MHVDDRIVPLHVDLHGFIRLELDGHLSDVECSGALHEPRLGVHTRAPVLAAREIGVARIQRTDIARDLRDPGFFIATGVYENGAALERQESAPEVHEAMAMFPDALAAPPERTIYDASVDPTLV